MATTEETLLVAAATRNRLINATTVQEVAITRAWLAAWDTLSVEVREAIEDVMARYKRGERVPRSVLQKEARLRAALAQALATLRTIAEDTADAGAAAAAAQVGEVGPDLERVVASQLPAGHTLPVVHAAPDALDAIVMRTRQRIHAQSWALSKQSVAAMRAELVRGVAVGDNPRTTARRILARTQGRFEGGLGRAMTIARTETLDAYRAASRITSEANTDVLAGRRWTAELGARTCAICIGKHGRIYPPGTDGPWDHPNGRCCFTDVTKSWRELGIDLDEPEPVWKDRDAWWDNLTADAQNRLIGPGRAELLRTGAVTWDDLSVRVDNPGWRPSFRLRPLDDLVTD